MQSVWDENKNSQQYEKLAGNIETEVLIVGGGIAGVLCAFLLKEKGIDAVLVEAGRIGQGVTHNTTAKITSQHGLIYDRLIRKFGIPGAKQYLNINQLAVEKYGELSKSIPCDFESKPAFVYSTASKTKLLAEVEAVNRLGFNAEFVTEIPAPVKIKGAVKFDNQAQFNPIKFINGISKGLTIYENTFVNRIHKNIAYIENGWIKAKKIIIASHFPFINTHGSYFLKMFQHRSYVIALENAQDLGGMYVDENENGMSFRNYGGLLLIGGGDHRTGQRGAGWAELRALARRSYSSASEKFAWATQDCMSLDGIPYIGRYSKSTPDLFVATGFNKWGMTSAMVSAMILSDLVIGKENEYSDLFSPDRSMLNKQLLINGFEAVKNLIRLSPKRCTHMGCSLTWNSRQRSWDCPCHGSRFDAHGNVIDNPAMRGLKHG